MAGGRAVAAAVSADCCYSRQQRRHATLFPHGIGILLCPDARRGPPPSLAGHGRDGDLRRGGMSCADLHRCRAQRQIHPSGHHCTGLIYDRDYILVRKSTQLRAISGRSTRCSSSEPHDRVTSQGPGAPSAICHRRASSQGVQDAQDRKVSNVPGHGQVRKVFRQRHAGCSTLRIKRRRSHVGPPSSVQGSPRFQPL
jgi:hypothetical protein